MGKPIEKFDVWFSNGDSNIWAYKITKQYKVTDVDINITTSISEIIHTAAGFTSKQSAWADAKAWLLTHEAEVD